MGTPMLLHTRLVQYAETCLLLGAEYEVSSGLARWGYATTTLCEAAGLEAAVDGLLAAYESRGPAAEGVTYAVAPVQHDVDDIAYATESYAEYLGTLYAASGRVVVSSPRVAQPLLEAQKELRKGCPDKRCAYELGAAVSASKVVAAKLSKRSKTACTLTAVVHDLATKTATLTATAKVGCGAYEVAEGLRGLSEKLR
jgi:hypothetical protein